VFLLESGLFFDAVFELERTRNSIVEDDNSNIGKFEAR